MNLGGVVGPAELSRNSKSISIVVMLGSACTTLGRMPATTAINAIPAERPGGELQGALIPVSTLSDAASAPGSDGTHSRNNRSSPQLLGLFEPDRWLQAPGVIVGARAWGVKHDSPFEPFVGYRRRLGSLALAGVAYGTHASGDSNGASYTATRFGLESSADARLAKLAWAELHVQVSVSGSLISARGTYCADDTGIAIDCVDNGPNRAVDGSLFGLYPSATAELGIDLGRDLRSAFHGARVALLGAVGRMPKLREGHQQLGDTYGSLGLSVTIGLGSSQ
jgi:hypothetical protein